MENKPNHEISELLARLQKNVEEKSEPKTVSYAPKGGESTEELLSLLKKNIGASDTKEVVSENQEYNIDGYEFEENLSSDDIAPNKETENLSTDQDEEVVEVYNETTPMADTESNPKTEMVTDMEAETVLVKQEDIQELQGTSVSPNSVLPEKEPETTETENAESVEILESSEPKETPNAVFEAEKTESDNLDKTNQDLADENTSAEAADGIEVNLEATNTETDEETDDEYEEIYFSVPMVKRFFRFRRLKKEQENAEKNEVLEVPDFDDVDINLALSLGSKEELENSIGYSRVRSARNGFYDPFSEESTGERTYGYRGEEFRSYEQIDDIKKQYFTEQNKIIRRLFSTFVLAIIILFLEHLPKTALKLPFLSEILNIPSYYYGMAVVLSVLLILFSAKRVLGGIYSCVSLHGEPFVPMSCLVILNCFYNMILLFFFSEKEMPTYNFVVAVFMLFEIVDEAMRLTREKLAFEVVSDRKPKLSLEQLENRAKAESADAFFAKQNFFVEKVNFVGNFFSRSGRRPKQFSECFHELALAMLYSLLMFVFSVCLTRDIAEGFTVLVFSMMICVPMQFLTISIYPFFHLTKGLSKLGSAVIGDAAIEEYNEADTIYLDDSEMFGKHGAKIVGLRAYNDMDFYELLSYALSVFSLVGDPLCNVFDNSVKEIEQKNNVKITHISNNGIEAIVDLFKTVYIGNIDFMKSHGLFPKMSVDDKRKIENNQVSILYMAIGDELGAKFYIQYTVTQRFEKFAAEMLKNRIRVGIRTLDPNVNEKMIAALRNDKDTTIKIIRPTPNELIPIGKHSESGIVTSKNPHMVFKILEQCFNIKQIHIKQRQFRLLELLVGFVLSAVVMLCRLYTEIPSLYIVLYQLAWFLPALIFTKSNLK